MWYATSLPDMMEGRKKERFESMQSMKCILQSSLAYSVLADGITIGVSNPFNPVTAHVAQLHSTNTHTP